MSRGKNNYKIFQNSYDLEHGRYIFILHRDGLDKAQEHLEILYKIYYQAITKEGKFPSSHEYCDRFLGSLYYLAKNTSKEYLRTYKNISTKDSDVLYNMDIGNKELTYNSIINELLDPIPNVELILHLVHQD